MIKERIHVVGSRILLMGLTFKENCPDIRNSKVVDIVGELSRFGAEVDLFDPWVSAQEAEHAYGLSPVEEPSVGAYDAIILTVVRSVS